MTIEKIKVYNLDSSWRILSELLFDVGSEVSPRGLSTIELEDVTVQYMPTETERTYTFENKVRRTNPVFHLVELFYFMKGRSDDVLLNYNHEMVHYLNPTTKTFYGSYGPPLLKGLHHVFHLFLDKTQRETRQAVIPILQTRHLQYLHIRDFPCNVFLGMRIRDGYLNFSLTTRSCDIYRGFIYDTLEFQLLQSLLAQIFDVKVGSYVHTINSLHLYKSDIPLINKALKVPSNSSKNRLIHDFMKFPFFSYVKEVNRFIDSEIRNSPYHPNIAFSDDIERAIWYWKVRDQPRFNNTILSVSEPYSRSVLNWLKSRKSK